MSVQWNAAREPVCVALSDETIYLTALDEAVVPRGTEEHLRRALACKAVAKNGTDSTSLLGDSRVSVWLAIPFSRDFRVGVTSKLVGAYNVSNCLAALTAAVYGLGIKPEIAAQGIASLEGIPGRMERIDMGQDFTAIVDFAHTPNALKVTLEASRIMTKGRVISVFGSAGLGDKEIPLVFERICDELYVFYVFDSDNGMRMITKKDLAEIKVDEATIRSIATQNLGTYFDKKGLRIRRIQPATTAAKTAVAV